MIPMIRECSRSDIHWDVEDLECSADAGWLAFTVNEDGLRKLYIMNCETRNILASPDIPVGTVGDLKMHPEKNLLAFSHTSPFALTSSCCGRLNQLV